MEALRSPLPDQEYFSIGEAARAVQVPPHTLRYWEQRLRLLRPSRGPSGHRRYSRRDLELAARVRELLRGGRMTLAGARQALLRERRRPGAARDAAGAPAGDLGRLLRDLRADLRGLLSELS